MFSRYLTSAALGLTVTCSLFLVMHLLIEISEAALTDNAPRHTLKWVKPIEDTPERTKSLTPERIRKPEMPPPFEAPVTVSSNTTGIGYKAKTTPTPPDDFDIPGLGVSNNALFNVIAVQPVYPAAAARNGLEGTVMVQFDVSASGAVENVVVVESSNRMFNKAAIDAARKFRYKARVVDGLPVATKSVRKLFRFAMEKG